MAEAETPGTGPGTIDSPLDQAEQALRAGRFAAARELLAAAHPDKGAEQQRARALWDRLAPDPLAIALVVGCLVLFVALIKIYVR